MRLPKYLWTREGNQAVLHEDNVSTPHDRQSLEKALAEIKAADRPPNKCGYLFERKRALNLAKFQAGLDLLTRGETP